MEIFLDQLLTRIIYCPFAARYASISAETVLTKSLYTPICSSYHWLCVPLWPDDDIHSDILVNHVAID